MDSYDVSEINRKLCALVRFGEVTAVDLDNARVQCSVGGLDTDWLPWIVWRAGGRRDWSPLTVGEQVVVFAPFGDSSVGFVLPSVYQDAHSAPSASADKDITAYPDGSTVEYDSASNTLTVNVSGGGNVIVNCKVATVHAATSVTLDTPQTNVTGNLSVTGAMNVQGVGAGGAVSTFAGSINITGGDVKADGIGLKSHHHTAQGATAPTTAAQA